MVKKLTPTRWRINYLMTLTAVILTGSLNASTVTPPLTTTETTSSLPHVQAGDASSMASTSLDFAPNEEDAALVPAPSSRIVLLRQGMQANLTAVKEPAVPAAGIAAWQNGDKAKAAKLFAAGAKKNAASAFWAYRAYQATGDQAQAQHYLELAAQGSGQFYGVLARQALQRQLTSKMAKYPVPQWKPERGYRIDPALIYALAKRESRFEADAQSPRGARGLLQIMPGTAYAIHRLGNKRDMGKEAVTSKLTEPAFNLALGQDYLKHLQEQPEIGNNLVYLLAAYNAGPNKLDDWRKSARTKDPLLFIERITFSETRNYVKQVLANYWIYAQITGSNTDSASALLNGGWPRLTAHKQQVAER